MTSNLTTLNNLPQGDIANAEIAKGEGQTTAMLLADDQRTGTDHAGAATDTAARGLRRASRLQPKAQPRRSSSRAMAMPAVSPRRPRSAR